MSEQPEDEESKQGQPKPPSNPADKDSEEKDTLIESVLKFLRGTKPFSVPISSDPESPAKVTTYENGKFMPVTRSDRPLEEIH